MCELFAMSSRLPTTVGLSLGRLAQHGSPARHLGDGWGVAFHDGADIRLLREPEPADASAWVAYLATQRVRARIVLSHIRHATIGEIALRNTQPFARELGGRMHVFAHNGHLPGIAVRLPGGRRFRPVGATDSEDAFCFLLERLVPLWDAADPPSVAARLDAITDVAAALRELGPANFLYTDGELLVAHGDRRTQEDGRIAPPGLVMLHRSCPTDPDALAAAGVSLHDAQEATLFASVPLSGEAWRPLAPGEIVAVHDGMRLTQSGAHTA